MMNNKRDNYKEARNAGEKHQSKFMSMNCTHFIIMFTSNYKTSVEVVK